MSEPVILFFWHGWLKGGEQASLTWLQISYGLGFALFALLFLGMIARWRLSKYPALWRMMTVFTGAFAAAAEIAMQGYPERFFLPLWAAALIGVSSVSILGKLLPQRFLKIWFDSGSAK